MSPDVNKHKKLSAKELHSHNHNMELTNKPYHVKGYQSQYKILIFDSCSIYLLHICVNKYAWINLFVFDTVPSKHKNKATILMRLISEFES